MAKDKPSDIAKKYLDAKGDPDREQARWNTQMGLPHRPNHGKQLPVDVLLSRREVFPAPVSDGVALLTAGVDTQDDRFEITITGWGRDEESRQSRMTSSMEIWKQMNHGSALMRI